MLNKEQDLLGSRYVTRSEVLESLDLVARGEVFPLVSVVRPLEEADGRARTGRARRGDRPGRASDRLSSLPPPAAEYTRTQELAKHRNSSTHENRHPRRLPGHGRSASVLFADPPSRREALSGAGRDLDQLVERLKDAEVVVSIRERVEFSRACWSRLPKLKLLALVGRSSHMLDFNAATDSAFRSRPE
jgi:hypothetical protein